MENNSMKSVVFKVLSVIIACAGLVLSIIETEPLIFLGFLAGGIITYELAEIIGNRNK